jgi:Tat protein translocase TatB subunit
VLNVGTPELLVIMVVALLVLGPEKLPEVARKVGNVVGELRRMSAGFQAEVRDAMQEPLNLPPVDPDPGPPAPDAGDESPPG